MIIIFYWPLGYSPPGRFCWIGFHCNQHILKIQNENSKHHPLLSSKRFNNYFISQSFDLFRVQGKRYASYRIRLIIFFFWQLSTIK